MIEPSILILSSPEGYRFANSIRSLLSNQFNEISIWNEGLIDIASSALENLRSIVSKSDFIIFIISEDEIIKRGKKVENFRFEVGLALGAVGRERVFVLTPASINEKFLTDLEGVNYIVYDNKSDDSIYEYTSRIRFEIEKFVNSSEVKEIRFSLENTNRIREDLNQINREVRNIYEQVEDRRIKIETFAKNVEMLSADIENRQQEMFLNFQRYEQRLSELYESSKEEVKQINSQTSELLEANKTLQKQVSELLQGANAGRLNATFEEKKKELEKGLGWWLFGIIFISLSVVSISAYEFIIKNSNPTNGMLIGRFLIILPLILLDVFFIFRYNSRLTSLEEYRYKSSVSLSLWAYTDIISKVTNDDSKNFILKSIDKIFENPNRPITINKTEDPNIISKLGEKALNIAEKSVEKITGK